MAGQGWPAPQIAAHLGVDQATGRNEIRTLARLVGWLARTRGLTISPGRLSVLLRQRGCASPAPVSCTP